MLTRKSFDLPDAGWICAMLLLQLVAGQEFSCFQGLR